jgi:hypothetical protein
MMYLDNMGPLSTMVDQWQLLGQIEMVAISRCLQYMVPILVINHQFHISNVNPMGTQRTPRPLTIVEVEGCFRMMYLDNMGPLSTMVDQWQLLGQIEMVVIIISKAPMVCSQSIEQIINSKHSSKKVVARCFFEHAMPMLAHSCGCLLLTLTLLIAPSLEDELPPHLHRDLFLSTIKVLKED